MMRLVSFWLWFATLTLSGFGQHVAPDGAIGTVHAYEGGTPIPPPH
jgi:hypothetical protein